MSFETLLSVLSGIKVAVDLTKEAAEYFKSRFDWGKFWEDAEKCFSNSLLAYERKVSQALPLKKLTPIRQAIQELIDSGNPHSCVDVVSEIIERDWKVDDARKLAESYCDCARRAVLAQSPPDQRVFLLIANALFDIEKLIKEGAGRPVNLPVPHYGDNVARFLNHYLSKDRVFVGREEELEKLLQVAHFKGKQFAFVTAPAGKGKSALLAQLWLRLGRSINPSLKTAFIPISTRFGTATKKAYFERLAHMLSAAYGIGEPEAGTDIEALKHYAFRLLENPPNDTYVVLIIDALDEATDWAPTDDHPIPSTLNPRVRVIMSARTTPEKPSAESWLRALGIPKEVEIINLGNLEKKHIREALERASLPEIPDDEIERVIEELYRVTEGGDPLLLDLYLEALNPGNTQIPRLTPEALREVEPGYEGYFDTWLKNLYEKLKKEGTPGELKELATDAFTLLALAKGPVSKTELADLTRYWAKREERAYSPYKFKAVLEHGSRLLAGDDIALSLAHPRLSEFFITEFANQHRGFKTAIADWGLQRIKEAAENPSEEIPRYLLEHLSSHLTEAGKLNELSELVISQVWFEQSRALDSTLRLLAQDIERLLDAVMNRGERPELWVTDTFYLNKLRMNANNLPSEIFTALAKLGRVAEAKAWIELITDERKKAEALVALLMGLSERDLELHADWLLDTARRANEPETLARVAQALAKNLPEMAGKAAHEALEAARKSEHSHDKARALAEVTQALVQTNNPKMAEEAAREALEIAHEIKDPDDKALALARIAQSLALTNFEVAEHATLEALEAAREIKYPDFIALAFAEIAQALAQMNSEMALETASGIEDPFFKGSALAKVALLLTQTNLKMAEEIVHEALETSRKIQDLEDKALALARVTQALASISLKKAETAVYEVLETARKIEDLFSKDSAFAKIAQALAQTDLEMALEIAREIEGSYYKAEAFAKITQALTPTRIEICLKKAREIEDPNGKTLALAKVAQVLAPTNRRKAEEIAREALEIAQEIEDPDSKALAFAGIAHTLAQTDLQEFEEAVYKTLGTSSEIQDPDEKALVLIGVAQALAPTRPETALEIAQKIEEFIFKALALSEVARALATTHPEKALEIAREIEESIFKAKYKTEALAEITGILAPTNQQKAQEVLLEAARAARAATMTWDWLEIAFPALAALDRNLVQPAYERLERILELLEG